MSVERYNSAIEGVEDVIATGDAGIREYLRLAEGTAATAPQWREYAEQSGNKMFIGLDEWMMRMVHEPLRLSKRGEPIASGIADERAVDLYDQTFRRVYRQSEFLRAMRAAWLKDDATRRIESADAIRFLTWQVRDAHDELDYLAKGVDYTDIQLIKQAVTGKPVRRQHSEKETEGKHRKPRKYFTDAELDSVSGIYREIALVQDRDPEEVRRNVERSLAAGAPLGTALLEQYAEFPPAGVMVGIDLETTGTSSSGDAIIDAGWEQYDMDAGLASDAQRHAYGLSPERNELGLKPDITDLTRIRTDDLQGLTPFEEDIEAQHTIMDALRGHTVVAHNANFEKNFLLSQCDGFGEALHDGTVQILDSLSVAHHCDPVRDQGFALDDYARRYGALGDDRTTEIPAAGGGMISLDQGMVERHLGLEDAHIMMRALRQQVLTVHERHKRGGGTES